jgi:hypothetical protein
MNYMNMPEDEFVDMLLMNTSMTPCLLIGNYVNAFKRKFKGTIERAYTLEKVRIITDEYDGVSNVNSEFLVIEGIGYLSEAGQNSLLKFIEESSLPIILLSYQDKVLNTIRSRMKIVAKKWTPIKALSYAGATECISAINEKKSQNQDFKGDLVIQFMADNSPELYRLRLEAGSPFDYNNDKVIELLSTDIRVARKKYETR